MKINYKNHFSLEYIRVGGLSKMNAYREDVFFLKSPNCLLRKEFERDIDYFKKQTIYISKSFFEAAILAREKMMEVISESDTLGILDMDGTYLCDGFTMMVRRSNSSWSIFIFNLDGCPMGYRSYDFKEEWESMFPSAKGIVDNAFGMALTTMLFKKYAQIETKIINPLSAQYFNDVYCRNDTNIKITYLNSSWFTSIVREAGFNVRGHFRLQACGEGMKDRKLIWVNDFQKSGYTREAGKLKVLTPQQ